jgi:hypothetical protein
MTDRTVWTSPSRTSSTKTFVMLPSVVRMLVRAPGGAHDLVAALDEVGEKMGADRTGRARHEYSHIGGTSVSCVSLGVTPKTR